MDFGDQLATILSGRAEGDDLVIRLDSTNWYDVEITEPHAIEIRLEQCVDVTKAENEIRSRVGEYIWSTEFVDRQYKLYLENRDDVVIGCASAQEGSSDFSAKEVLGKFRYLSERYVEEGNDGVKIRRKYSRLRSLLSEEIGKELENWKLKRTHFESHDTSRVKEADLAIHLCSRFLNYIEQVEKEDE